MCLRRSGDWGKVGGLRIDRPVGYLDLSPPPPPPLVSLSLFSGRFCQLGANFHALFLLLLGYRQLRTKCFLESVFSWLSKKSRAGRQQQFT